MSIHRSLDPSPTEDIPGDLCLRTGKASSEQSQPKQAGEAPETYGRLRKGAPANKVLPRTLKWADELPAPLKPVALMRQFPRIANLIAAAWDDLVQFEIYMDSLLTDKRGGRKGFPASVIAELTALDIHRHTARERELPPIPWSDGRRRG
jgi:hypothetical protein